MLTQGWIFASCLSFILLLDVVDGETASDNPKEGSDEKREKPNHSPGLARGWGDDINWVQMDDALKIVKSEKRPMFLLIHKSWCPACQTLKPKFIKAKPIAELSKYFVMVNAEDDEEPWEDDYKPDGAYIPRILFLDTEGKVMNDIKNTIESSDQYQYYYPSPVSIIKSMKNVLKKLKVVDEDILDKIEDGTAKPAGDKQEL